MKQVALGREDSLFIGSVAARARAADFEALVKRYLWHRMSPSGKDGMELS